MWLQGSGERKGKGKGKMEEDGESGGRGKKTKLWEFSLKDTSEKKEPGQEEISCSNGNHVIKHGSDQR